jgi:hypothetical protein
VKTRIVLIVLAAICFLYTTPVYAGPIHFEGVDVITSCSYGTINGYTQTPAGGKPGTTSHERPTFEEIGIDSDMLCQIGIIADTNWGSIFAKANLLNPTGETRIDKDFIFHNQEYLAGTRVKSSLTLDWYDIGYKYRRSMSEKLTLSPAVMLSLWRFSAELDDGTPNDRTYSKGAIRLGLETEYRINENLSISLEATGSAPLENTPKIYTANLKGKYTLLNKDSYKVSAHIGAGYTIIDYKDQQEVPNHIYVEMPMVTAGIEIRL